jgi:hypothetical protein
MSIRSKSRVRKFVVSAAVAAGGLAALAGPAHAAVVDTDTFAINGEHADFGRDPHLLGTPLVGGDVVFSVNSGVVTASISGRTYLDDLAGSCARVKLDFLRADNTVIAGLSTTGVDVCSASSGLHESAVWTRTRSGAQIAKVRVSTQIQLTNGNFTTTGSKTAVMNDD